MGHRDVQAVCGTCGTLLAASSSAAPVRCEACFEAYLRDIDIAFLESYAAFGCLGRQVVAESCLRAMVLDSPSHRKLLAVAIFEQFILAVSDFLALHRSVRLRRTQPIVRTFLEFRIDVETAERAFAYFGEEDERTLLVTLGLPHPDDLLTRYPDTPKRDASLLQKDLHSVLRGLRRLGDQGAEAGAALVAALDGFAGTTALVARGSWEDRTLRSDEVAALALDLGRRRLAVQSMPADEHVLEDVVDMIDTCTSASRDLIHALLAFHDPANTTVAANLPTVLP